MDGGLFRGWWSGVCGVVGVGVLGDDGSRVVGLGVVGVQGVGGLESGGWWVEGLWVVGWDL